MGGGDIWGGQGALWGAVGQREVTEPHISPQIAMEYCVGSAADLLQREWGAGGQLGGTVGRWGAVLGLYGAAVGLYGATVGHYGSLGGSSGSLWGTVGLYGVL